MLRQRHPWPAASATPQPGGPELAHVPAPAGRTILLVDQDPDQRSQLRSTLERHGYRVHTAVDARHALALLGGEAAATRLLVTDLGLSGMSGRGLAMAVKVMRPQMRVIYMSADKVNTELLHNSVEDAFSYLHKPIHDAELLSRVEQQFGAITS